MEMAPFGTSPERWDMTVAMEWVCRVQIVPLYRGEPGSHSLSHQPFSPWILCCYFQVKVEGFLARSRMLHESLSQQFTIFQLRQMA